MNDFTDRYPNPSAYTHANVVVSQTTSINEDTCNDAQAKMVSDITSEDEDLQAALALSMPVNTMNTNTNTKVRGDENAVVASSSVSVAVGSGGPSDIVGFVCAHYLNATHRNSDLNTNATSTGEAFRIQFKLKNRKIVKKFNGDDNVFDLLACVAALVVDESPSEPPVGFDLLFGYPTTNSFFSLLTNPDGSADIDTSILLSNFKTELYNSQIVIKLL